MKTLEQIKNDISIKHGYANYISFLFSCKCDKDLDAVINEIAIESQKQALQNASENVKTKLKDNVHELSMNDDWSEIDNESITNENNIIK